MALINCPECNKEISDKAIACPNCGFPIQEMIQKLNKTKFSPTGMNVCPKCGKFYSSKERCPDCNTEMIDCHCTNKESHNMTDNGTYKQWKQQIREKYVVGSSEFDENLYNKRLQEEKATADYYASIPRRPSEPKVTCPYCKSTNTKKISSMAKAANVAMFGIFGNKRKHQWHCNKCGSDF